MNHKITHCKLLIGLLVLISLAGSGAQAQDQTRQVTVIQDTAPVGLIYGQTLRYTWAFITRPLHNREFEPLRIRVRLLDADGSVISQEEAAAVGAGQFQSFDFNRDLISLAGEPGTGRLQTRLEATLVVIQSRTGSVLEQSILQTFANAVEVIDNSSGRSTVRFSGTKGNQIISAGNDYLIGIVPGQSLRVSAAIADNPGSSEAEPINFKLRAYDRAGNVIGESDEVEVPRGQFRTIRFNYEDLRVTSEPGTGRKQVRLRMFAIVDRTHLSPILASFETVEDSTGKTSINDQVLVFFVGGIPNN
jgi:hypothetical protein